MQTLQRSDIEIVRFPDGQTHVNIPRIISDEVHLIWPIRNAEELVLLAQISNALDGVFACKTELDIPYLMGARSDRHMQKQDSCDLRVVADIINLCNWDKVNLFDVHSDVALQLINRSTNLSNQFLVDEYYLPNSVLICPDAGAQRKVTNYFNWNPNLTEVVYCFKERDSLGKITSHVPQNGVCTDKTCVIIDDICDGGATFIEIAKQIKPRHLTLIVTHGIFSKGLKHLFDNGINHIITSDSYQSEPLKRIPMITLVEIYK